MAIETGRRARVAQLRRQGLSNPEIAQREGCDRSTVWRIVRSLPPESPPEPIEGPEPAGRLLEIDDLALSVGVLRDRAQSGSAAAARDLAKLSLGEIHRQGCADHVNKSSAERDMIGVYQICKAYVAGPFLRRAALELEIDEGRLSEMIEDTFDDIARECESRSEAKEAE